MLHKKDGKLSYLDGGKWSDDEKNLLVYCVCSMYSLLTAPKLLTLTFLPYLMSKKILLVLSADSHNIYTVRMSSTRKKKYHPSGCGRTKHL